MQTCSYLRDQNDSSRPEGKLIRADKVTSGMMTVAEARRRLGVSKDNKRFRQLVHEMGNDRKLPRDAVEALRETKILEDTCRSVGSVVNQLKKEFPDPMIRVSPEWLKESARRELRISPKKAEFHATAELFNVSETDKLLALARAALRRPRILNSELATKWRLPVELITDAARACGADRETRTSILFEDISTIKNWIQKRFGFIETEVREKLIEREAYKRKISWPAKKHWSNVRDWLQKEKMTFQHGHTFYFDAELADERIALLISELKSSRRAKAKKTQVHSPPEVKYYPREHVAITLRPLDKSASDRFISVTVAYHRLTASGLAGSDLWLFRRLRALWAAGVIELEQQTTGLYVRESDLSKWLKAGDVPSLPRGRGR